MEKKRWNKVHFCFNSHTRSGQKRSWLIPQPMGNDAIAFAPGKVVCGRWKVLSRLGAGGCGSVYKVEDLQRKGYIAALKVEPIVEDDPGVLKLEAAVLKKLADRKNVIRLLMSGKRSKYSFIVMTICGSDLMSLKKKSPEGFSESTILRIGIHALYAIKQLHEIGFVHRDVKPGNMMNGATGRDRRIIFLIDYGMVRNFVVRNAKGISLRKPRKNVLLRGTLRYCSLSVHRRLEQGRVDDLWAMLYMLGELYVGLPWNRITVEKEIVKMKERETDENVFRECPEEFVAMAKYLRTLNYQDRPDYYKIYKWFIGAMKRENYTFSEKYEWEDDSMFTAKLNTALDYSVREKSTKKSLEGYEKEALLYTNIHEHNFKEVILSL
ncbi:hypothetical protein OESDEN_01013 [Oesophagostomum dentatum]|uniref:Protein kinase domain-containing protein n=1 Tax=Oesophagostomum dentatum TaxID=61180 RepID=A0A0B1TN69_OESDE|nr:hypothetical protein OESDEN_01013 [Oesophagostomum dentatum]